MGVRYLQPPLKAGVVETPAFLTTMELSRFEDERGQLVSISIPNRSSQDVVCRLRSGGTI